MDTQQREGIAGDCLPPISSEALDEVFASLLTPQPMTCPWAAGAMERGTRTQPQHTEQLLKHGAATNKHTRRKLSTGKREGRENSPGQCHLCLLFNIRQQATGSGLFHFRTYFTCFHCNLVNNQLQVNFLWGLEE